MAGEKTTIYFAASIQGTRSDIEFQEALKTTYRPIIAYLKEHGDVVNARVFEEDLRSQKDEHDGMYSSI